MKYLAIGLRKCPKFGLRLYVWFNILSKLSFSGTPSLVKNILCQKYNKELYALIECEWSIVFTFGYNSKFEYNESFKLYFSKYIEC